MGSSNRVQLGKLRRAFPHGFQADERIVGPWLSSWRLGFRIAGSLDCITDSGRPLCLVVRWSCQENKDRPQVAQAAFRNDGRGNHRSEGRRSQTSTHTRSNALISARIRVHVDHFDRVGAEFDKARPNPPGLARFGQESACSPTVWTALIPDREVSKVAHNRLADGCPTSPR